jgi:hypothetical protein
MATTNGDVALESTATVDAGRRDVHPGEGGAQLVVHREGEVLVVGAHGDLVALRRR